MNKLQVQELNSIDSLESIATTWDTLLSKTAQANYFQSLTWLKCYWKHYGEGQELRVLLVKDEQEPIGIVPLVRKQEKTRVGVISYLTYPMDYWGSFYGPISEQLEKTWAAAIGYLNDTGLGEDVLELRWLTGENDHCEQSREFLTSAGYNPILTCLDSTAVIDLPATWEDYLASRSGKWRNNYRRWQRKLEEHGEVSYERFRPSAESKDPGWHVYEECLRIAKTSWQSSSETGTTLTHEEVALFLKDLHEAAAQEGCVDVSFLKLDGRAIAFAYNYVYQGSVYGLRVGYDASVPCKGAGNLLYAKAIEDSICRGDWRYDLGPRHINVKRSLMTAELPSYRLSCYQSRSVRQQLMRLKRNWDNRQLEKAAIPTTSAANTSSPVSQVTI